MKLTHDFTVQVPLERAWLRLCDVTVVARCVPGAVLSPVSADEFAGKLTVRLTGMQVTYRGEGRIVERDDAAHRLVMDFDGKEARGDGAATVRIAARLSPESAATRVDVRSDVAVTGRLGRLDAAQLSDLAARIFARFAAAFDEDAGRDANAATADVLPAAGARSSATAAPTRPASEVVTAGRAVASQRGPGARINTSVLRMFSSLRRQSGLSALWVVVAILVTLWWRQRWRDDAA